MKICPNCGDEHDSRSKYCGKIIKTVCPICQESFEQKCDGKMKEMCSKGCVSIYANNVQREKKKNAPIEICQRCGKEFQMVKKTKDGIIGCSHKCRLQLRIGQYTCKVCGDKYWPNSKDSVVCSSKCTSILGNKKQAENAKNATLIKKCPVCNEEFNTIEGGNEKIYCSSECRGKFNNDRQSLERKRNKEVKICPRCNKEHDNSMSDYCGEIKKKVCPSCNDEFDYKCLKRERTYCSDECSRIGMIHKQQKGDLEKICPGCGNKHRYTRSDYCKELKDITCSECGEIFQRKCSSKMPETCSKSCTSIKINREKSERLSVIRAEKRQKLNMEKSNKEQEVKRKYPQPKIKDKETKEIAEKEFIFEHDINKEIPKTLRKEQVIIKECVNCGDQHINTDSDFCGRIKTIKCSECNEIFEVKCEGAISKLCSIECEKLELDRMIEADKIMFEIQKEKEINELKDNPGLKICPRCDNYHNHPMSEYCCEERYSQCLNCGKLFIEKCTKHARNYCNPKCGRSHKPNECLTCGEPAKEKYCRKEIIIICKTCGKEHKTKCGKTISQYCSGVCAMKDPEIQKKVKQTQINKYGSFAFNTDKQKETMIERYGYNTPSKSEKVKAKIKETQFINNGGQFAFNTEKQRETMIDKYGSPGRLGDPKEVIKQKNIMMERYGVATPSEHPEFLNKAMNTLMDKYGKIFNTSDGIVSRVNTNFADKLEDELGIIVDLEHIVQSDGILFDLYIPEYNIAVELNPTITHNSTKSFACVRNKCENQSCEIHETLSPEHHYNRSKIAQKNGIDLIQKFEWNSDEEIIKIIKNKIKDNNILYNIDNLKIDNISVEKVNLIKHEYIKKTNYHKMIAENSKCYTLSNENDIISIIVFSKLPDNSTYEWTFEYFIKSNVCINNISSLIERFTEEFNPINIISYLDFNITTKKNTFLNNLNFMEIEDTGPELFLHNSKMNKIILPHDICKTDIENYITEEEYVKVYSAGNRVFVWNN